MNAPSSGHPRSRTRGRVLKSRAILRISGAADEAWWQEAAIAQLAHAETTFGPITAIS